MKRIVDGKVIGLPDPGVHVCGALERSKGAWLYPTAVRGLMPSIAPRQEHDTLAAGIQFLDLASLLNVEWGIGM